MRLGSTLLSKSKGKNKFMHLNNWIKMNQSPESGQDAITGEEMSGTAVAPENTKQRVPKQTDACTISVDLTKTLYSKDTNTMLSQVSHVTKKAPSLSSVCAQGHP